MPTQPDLLIPRQRPQPVACAKCGHPVAPVTVDKKGRCGNCRVEVERRWAFRTESRTTVEAWDDLRARRNVLLAATDWTQLADVPQPIRERFGPVRRQLRDLTDGRAYLDALDALAALEVEIRSLA